MKNKYHLIVPALLVDFIMLSVITSLIRQQSDMAVIVGSILIVATLYGNYFLIKYITKKHNEKNNAGTDGRGHCNKLHTN